MQLNPSSTERLFQDSLQRYEIPAFQRHYAWDMAEWRPLWNDIVDLIHVRRSDQAAIHFLGVVLIQNHIALGGQRHHIVLDGQQRLSTFQILLNAIRTTSGDETTSERLKNLLFASGSKTKLILQHRDAAVFQKVLREQDLSQEEREHRIAKAYTFFQYQVNAFLSTTETGNDRADLLKELVCATIECCKFAVITLNAGNNIEGEMVFETINGRGRHLDQWELLRNNLFFSARREGTAQECFDQIWKPSFEGSQKLAEFWSQNGESEKFFRLYLRLKLGRAYHSVDDHALYLTYKKEVTGNEAKDARERILEIAKFADAYVNLFCPTYEKADRKLWRLLDQIDQDKSDHNSQVPAFLMFVYLQNGIEETKKALELLISYARLKGRDAISQESSQLANIIDWKREFVYRDLHNWLSHRQRQGCFPVGQVQNNHEEVCLVVRPPSFQEWNAPPPPGGQMRAALEAAGVRPPLAIEEVEGEQEERKISLQQANITRSDVQGRSFDSCTNQWIERRWNFSEVVLLGPKEALVEGGEGDEVEADILQLQREYGRRQEEDGIYRDLVYVPSERAQGGVFVDAGIDAEDVNLHFMSLGSSKQDPVLVYLILVDTSRILARFGSLDNELLYLRSSGKDIIIPKSSVNYIRPIYEGYIRQTYTNTGDLAIIRFGEKRWFKISQDTVVHDVIQVGELARSDRVRFWLRLGDGELVDGLVRVENGRLSDQTIYRGRLKYWGIGSTYGWMRLESEQIDVMVHETAFRSMDIVPEDNVGRMFSMHLVECHRVGRRAIQARNLAVVC